MANNYLCFDFGLKRIGVAIGSDLIRKARQLSPMKAKDGIPNWQELEKLLREWQPKAVIVGLPLNMDGTESELSTRARKFGNRIHGRFHTVVHMHDERLSSYEAKGMVLEEKGHVDFGDHSVDGLAACLVLESWFESRNENDEH
jgi:putative Holliday junction resolvase